jgi:hypothetical protein
VFFEGSGWTAAHFSSWRAGLAAMMGGEYPGWVTGNAVAGPLPGSEICEAEFIGNEFLPEGCE